MRLLATIVLPMMVLLSSCGPAQMGSSQPEYAGSTGYFDKKDHNDFIHNGDAYVVKRQQELEVAPAPTPAGQKPIADGARLNDRVNQFEMSRFDAGAKTPTLFGAGKLQIKIFFTDAPVAEFNGAFDPQFKFKSVSGDYQLEGSFKDFRSAGAQQYQTLDRTSGVVYLTNLKTKERLEISYRGLKKRYTVLPDQQQAMDTAFSNQLKEIEKTSLWENNWTVISGKSFYLNDFIVSGNSAQTSVAPVLAFRGESKRTSTKDEAYTIAAESLTKATAPDVTMVGNSEVGGKRAFQVTLEDDKKQKHEVLVLTEPEHEDPSDVPDDIVKTNPGAPVNLTTQDQTAFADPLPPESSPSDAPVVSNTTSPAAGVSSAVPLPPVRPNFASTTNTGYGPYLPIHRELRRTALMTNDLERNRNIPGVLQMIKLYQTKRRQDLQNFFDNAYPFRALMSALAQAFDTNPIYVYLSVDESDYFTGGQYHIATTGDGGLAIGPFQLHPDTAQENHLFVGHGSHDERRYFATSGCGAAHYVAQNAQKSIDSRSDTTFSLMAFNQGPTGALRLSKKFGARWAQLDATRAGMPLVVRDYVNRKLAFYFVANNRRYYGFPDLSGHEKKQYPTNDTLSPRAGIHDLTCRAAVATILK